MPRKFHLCFSLLFCYTCISQCLNVCPPFNASTFCPALNTSVFVHLSTSKHFSMSQYLKVCWSVNTSLFFHLLKPHLSISQYLKCLSTSQYLNICPSLNTSVFYDHLSTPLCSLTISQHLSVLCPSLKTSVFYITISEYLSVLCLSLNNSLSSQYLYILFSQCSQYSSTKHLHCLRFLHNFITHWPVFMSIQKNLCII